MPDRSISKLLTPGERLRAEIRRQGLDQGKLAELTNVSRQTINNIVNGRYPISRGMAARLALLTGQRLQYWLQDEFSEAGLEQAQPAIRLVSAAEPATAAKDSPGRDSSAKSPTDADTEQTCVAELLHDLLRRYAQPAVGEHRPSAAIDKIGIRFVADSEEAARASAAAAALGGLLEFVRTKPELMDEAQVWGYRSLIADIGAKLLLDAAQARELVRLLGLGFVGAGNAVQLRNGRLKILALPPATARIELRALAEQLDEPLTRTIARIAASG